MIVTKKRKVLIVGYGQDGKILHEQLSKKKIYSYIITKNKITSNKAYTNIKKINITDRHKVFKFLNKTNNLDIYFLATHNISSSQKESQSLFKKNYNSNVIGLINFLEFMKKNRKKNLKLFYASSSHIFEKSNKMPQNENTIKSFNSNYGFIKYLGLKICEYYRENLGIFCSVGILYTHVSKHVNKNFLIKELSTKIKKNNKTIFVKNKNAKLDIMSAEDAVNGMQLILKLKKPDTFIVSSGKLTPLKKIFNSILKFYKIKKKIVLKNKASGKINNSYLLGNSKKLFKKTKWKPKLNIDQLISNVLS